MRTFKSRAIATGSRYANDAAAFAAFAAVLGTIAVIAATRHRDRPAWSHHPSL